MSIGFIFWLLMILALFFGFPGNPWTGAGPWGPRLGWGLTFILFFLLGWHDFGFVIHQ